MKNIETAAAPPVDALAAEHARNVADQESAAAIEAARYFAHADAVSVHAAAVAEREAKAADLSTGKTVPAADLDAINLRVAKAASAVEMHAASIGPAQIATQGASRAALNTEFRLAERDARRLRGPEGEKQRAVGEAALAWRASLDDCRAATQARLDGEAKVEHLRAELFGLNPLARPFVTKINEVALHTLSLSLPGDVLVALIENHAAQIDYIKVGEANLERAKAAG